MILGGFFNFLIAALPLLMLNANSKEFIGLYDRLVYTLVMMILVMCRLTLSFGYAFIIVIEIYKHKGLFIRGVPYIT